MLNLINHIIYQIKENSIKKQRKGFISKTEQHIRIMKIFKETHPDYPLIIPNKEDNLYAMYLPLEATYSRFYFPHFPIEKLKDYEKTQYLFLRAEIDKILKINWQPYHLPKEKYNSFSLCFGHRI